MKCQILRLPSSLRWRLTFFALFSALAGVGVSRVTHAPTAATFSPIKEGPETVLVFIGSSTCSGIYAPGLRGALKKVRTTLGRQALDQGTSFVSIGISTDWEVPLGIRLLDRLGPFDEIVVGRKNLNTGALRYVWRDFPGPPIFPQLVILDREVLLEPVYSVARERVRVRKAGARSIISWAKSLSAMIQPRAPTRIEVSSLAQIGDSSSG